MLRQVTWVIAANVACRSTIGAPSGEAAEPFEDPGTRSIGRYD
jgi:hypothetical protein